MTIKELKNQIENENIELRFSIYKYTDNTFLALQYIDAISKILERDIVFLDDLNTYTKSQNILFLNEHTSENTLNIFITNVFEEESIKLISHSNLIIVCKKMSESCKKIFADYIIEFPKLEKWQIKDYVYSLAQGVDTQKLDYFIELCNWDIYRIDNELNKIKLFSKNERKYKFNRFLDDGIFSDLTMHNIFDFSNALLKKDIPSLTNLYAEIEKIDCEPLGLVTLLYNNLKNIISIQLDPSCTAEKLNMTVNRFWAIKKNNCGYYTKTQLIKSFELVTSIDKKLKTGEITSDVIVDYIVCHMLSF